MIICKIIVIPKKKPRFQKEFIWRGQGYDCKWDFISNTKDKEKEFKDLWIVTHFHYHLIGVDSRISEINDGSSPKLCLRPQDPFPSAVYKFPRNLENKKLKPSRLGRNRKVMTKSQNKGHQINKNLKEI